MTAAEIDIILPVISGQIMSVATNQFVIQDGQGFWRTVNTSTSTLYSSGGTPVASAAIVTGANVVAFGAVDVNHTDLDAASVFILGPTTEGEVLKIHGDRLLLRTLKGARVTVVTGPHTIVRVHGRRASLRAIKLGRSITVLGRSRHGLFRATEVRA